MDEDRAATDTSVYARRDALLNTMGRTEAVNGLALFAGLIVAYRAVHLVLGHVPVSAIAATDLVQVFVFAVVAIQLHRGRLPERLVPAAIMGAIVVGVAGQTYQSTIDGERWAILIVITTSGSVVLDWHVFRIGSAISAAIAVAAFATHDPARAVSWSLGTAVAIGVAANVVRSRRNSAMDLARAQISLEQLATVDPLTELLNRRGLNKEIRFVRGAARRLHEPLFAVFIDVGGLKRLNDTHGHHAGDRLLLAVARALRGIARETDLACRWGGDEFLLVGVGKRPDPEAINQRMLAAIDLSTLRDMWQPLLWVGSAASSSPVEGVHDVILRADADLYANRAVHPDLRR